MHRCGSAAFRQFNPTGQQMDTMLVDVSRRASRLDINLDDLIDRDENHPPFRGGFANVYRGTIRSCGRQVAIKAVHTGLKDDVSGIKVYLQGLCCISYSLTAVQRALKEVQVWSKLQHENILPLLGITTDFDFTVSIVSPWMQAGNAFDHVQDESVDPGPLVSTTLVIE